MPSILQAPRNGPLPRQHRPPPKGILMVTFSFLGPRLACFWTSHKWTHQNVLLCLTSLTAGNVGGFVHIVARSSRLSFLLPDSTPWYERITICFFILLISIRVASRFQLVNKASRNIALVDISTYFLGYIPGHRMARLLCRHVDGFPRYWQIVF